MGASAAALVSLLFPYDASAVGFRDFGPDGQSMVIRVADGKGGGDAGNSKGGEKGDKASAGADGAASDVGTDAANPSGSDESADVGVDAPDVGVDAPDVDVDAPDVDVDAPDDDVDAPDVDANTPDVDADAPDVDADAPDVNVDTPDVDASAPDVDVSAPAPGHGTSSGSAGSAPQGQRGATPAGNTASAEVREAPSGTILVPSGRAADGVDAQLTTVCLAGDPKCTDPEPSPAPAPAAPAATGVWPPQDPPPPAQPVAAAHESPLAISLVSPIKGRDGLVVQGIVVNESREPQAVPPIQINLVNKAGQTLQRWTIRPPIRQLLPGGNKAFKTVLQPVPADVARADAAFLAMR